MASRAPTARRWRSGASPGARPKAIFLFHFVFIPDAHNACK